MTDPQPPLRLIFLAESAFKQSIYAKARAAYRQENPAGTYEEEKAND